MTIETAEVMLLAWGEWNRGHSGLGTPRLSVIGRCIIEGPGASHSTVQGEPHMPRAVEIVESCMLDISKPLLRAAEHRYIGQEADTTAARKLRVSVDIYQSRINQVVHYLSDFLVAGT